MITKTLEKIIISSRLYDSMINGTAYRHVQMRVCDTLHGILPTNFTKCYDQVRYAGSYRTFVILLKLVERETETSDETENFKYFLKGLTAAKKYLHFFVKYSFMSEDLFLVDTRFSSLYLRLMLRLNVKSSFCTC